jgi:arginine decarboxylase
MQDNPSNWTIEDAVNAYQINRWSEGYFSVNKAGELTVLPTKNSNGPVISIPEIIDEMKKEGIQFPCVIRFHDILRNQVVIINETFKKIIKEANFQGDYYGVFPIKVNQLREVIEEIVDVGANYNYGLEAGSKAELLTVLAYNNNQRSLTILNGYKDKEYMQLACLGTQMGNNMVIVIEKFSELLLILEVIEEMEVAPILGVRAKLASKGSGKWSDSAGENAKFGLSIAEILEVIDTLKAKNKLHLLQLFHFHSGSQIPDIRTIKDSLTEAARIYSDLVKLEAPIKYFDVGGGVGLNYDGSRSNTTSSTNYTLDDYVADVVYILKDICDDTQVPHPHIVTETGRAVCAYHSCVITNVFGNIEMTKAPTQAELAHDDKDHLIIRNMKSLIADLNHSNYQDIYNDACILKEEAISAFKLGVLHLKQRAQAENIFANICHQIIAMTENEKYVPLEIKKLKFNFSDKYLCNFSLFQSAPDSWAIQQILPVVPIRRLNEKPTNEATLADITCDSDGKITNFLGPDGHRPTIPLHKVEAGEEYLIGVFLTGAYQDIMGDMHNLFGRLNEVHVYSDDDDPSDFYIEEIIHGQSAAQVLSIMQYNPNEMCRLIKNRIDGLVRSGSLKPKTGVRLTDFYEASINGYTYLEGL